MLIPANRLLDGLQFEVNRLKTLLADSDVDGSAFMAITNGLQMLRGRQPVGLAAMSEQIFGLEVVLTNLEELIAGDAPAWGDTLSRLRAQLREMKSLRDAGQLELQWRGALSALQSLVFQVNSTASVTQESKKAVVTLLSTWEAGFLRMQAHPVQQSSTDTVAVDVTQENLTVYLRDRFAEPGLQVTSFEPLAGGFGKQTILFSTQGQALAGSFVMRRDMGMRPSVANDCHLTRDEYPVIKAVFARGFPAPEALWLDVEHQLLPGGDFIVMRRSPGKLPGNFFGASMAIPDTLTNALGDLMARLHTQAPMTELGDLTESIRTDRWAMSKGECTSRYIRSWYELYLREEHTPSPALTAIYGWLLDNVPQRTGPPSLLHGDIGLHNFLFEGDQLSAVLDWEFAHVGDPAEELGYVMVTVGKSINWTQLMERYIAGGGEPVDEKTMRYFQVWGLARNATGANLISTLLANGHALDLKLAMLPTSHIPLFIQGAQALIEQA